MKFIVRGKDLIVHVNRQHIAQNAKDGGDRLVYTLKDNGTIIYAREVLINGRSRFVYNGEQLRCGARAWCEVSEGAEVELIDPMPYAEAKEAA